MKIIKDIQIDKSMDTNDINQSFDDQSYGTKQVKNDEQNEMINFGYNNPAIHFGNDSASINLDRLSDKFDNRLSIPKL